PDKILLFSAFPLNNSIIFPLFKAYGIEFELLNGQQSEAHRAAAIERFKRSGREGPRVLLMSSVGTIGLNLTFAHIIIFLDTLWSAQEDSQTIGRVWRKGQTRRVIVYRPIVLGTSDVFLNSLAFSKELMHLAFVNAPRGVRKCLFLGMLN
ncbi:hypothetical protein FOMPIDRAFT_1137725, partial [Fomitopsis schrenkii]